MRQLAKGLGSVMLVACAAEPTPSPPPVEPVAAPAPEPRVVAPQTEPGVVVLDTLFAGIEKGCRRNEVLGRLLDSVATWDDAGSAWQPSEAVDAPADVAVAFGKPQLVSTEAGHSVVGVSVSGARFRGLPVTEVVRWMGHGNGIHGYAIGLDVGQPEADKTLRAALTIVDSCADDPICPVEPSELRVVDKGGKAQIVCDLST